MTGRRLVRVCAALTAAGFLMAACGSDDKSESTTASTAAATTTAAGGGSTTAAGGGSTTTAAGAANTAGSAPSSGGGAATGGLAVDTAKCTAPSGASVKLQLQWVAQSQFAGYFAAVDKGFYKDLGLDVDIVQLADSTVVPVQQVATGAADFAISWVPKALAAREAGAKVTDIAQVFQRSGTLQVSLKDKDITSVADFEGKKIGNWGYGNEYEIFAALSEEGLDPAKDVTLVAQQFDVSGLTSGDIDAIEAMTYNEYAQVLESTNEATGKPYTADDLNVVSYEDAGVGMLQDAIWADQEKLSDPAYCGEALALVQGSLEGWAYCRDNATECRDIVMKQNPPYGGASHQLWQMNEINALIWPSPDGVGVIDQAAWDRTVEISQQTKNLDGKTVLTKAPDAESFTNDIVEAALANLAKDASFDDAGADFQKQTVTVNPGGN
jgi:NitT/TauT family transport system substrate-binding protein